MGRVTHYDTVQMMTYLLGQRENVAKYWVTVTAGQTHTIQSLGVSAATVVSWGDGLSNEYTGTATRTHIYASAGTYEVKIYTPENVTVFDLRDAVVSVLNSADLKLMANVSTFYLNNPTSDAITLNSSDMVDWRPTTFYLNTPTSDAITLNSADMVDWRPSDFTLYNLTSSTITINSADMVDWLPSTFNFYNLPNATITLNSADMVDWRPGTFSLFNLTSATITLNSADMVDWRPGYFRLYALPNATITIAPSSIKNWSTSTTIDLRTRNLTQPQCDLILWECYQIARTVAGGTINMAIAGNAAPSGVFQPCQSPPVSATTPGREVAYELLNDSLGVGFNKWATVSTN
jgi:hypothetical protein